MNVTLADSGEIYIDAGLIQLGRVHAMVDGKRFPELTWVGIDSPGAAAVYETHLPGGIRFRLECRADASRSWMQYSLRFTGSPLLVRSFGLSFDRVGAFRAALRNGYFSWDGSYFVPRSAMTAKPLVRGYAVTQLLPVEGPGCVVVGFDRHDRFQQTFTFAESGAGLAIETHWDEKTGAGDIYSSERLGVKVGAGVEAALQDWAEWVAASAPIAPRLAAPAIRGWCSWYNLYAAITEENILQTLRGVRATVARERLPMEVFQIDDGFTPEMGDWLDVKPQFPRGMKPVLDEIRAAGFRPGLWIAPFMVGNRSRLYQEHPDWVVGDRDTGGPLAHMRFYAEFRWHKRSEEYYILDVTHPGAREYIRRVFETWRRDWGCEYFKTDFMHFGSEYGPERAVWHRPGSSRIEIWRSAAVLIREAIGDATWLGCGCPLWASVGLVDGIRIGRDIGVEWEGNHSAQSLLRDQATRNFAHGILWQADPDCILLRDRFHHLTEIEVRSLGTYAGLTGGVTMTSDALDELSAPRLEFWKWLLSLAGGKCEFPRLGSALAETHSKTTDTSAPTSSAVDALDPILLQTRWATPERAVVYIFNPTEIARSCRFRLDEIGFRGAMEVINPHRSGAPAERGDWLELKLLPHEGQLRVVSAVEASHENDRRSEPEWWKTVYRAIPAGTVGMVGMG